MTSESELGAELELLGQEAQHLNVVDEAVHGFARARVVVGRTEDGVEVDRIGATLHPHPSAVREVVPSLGGREATPNTAA